MVSRTKQTFGAGDVGSDFLGGAGFWEDGYFVCIVSDKVTSEVIFANGTY